MVSAHMRSAVDTGSAMALKGSLNGYNPQAQWAPAHALFIRGSRKKNEKTAFTDVIVFC